jgi:hypothetical protein
MADSLKFSVTETRLNNGGYDRTGRYYGISRRLYFAVAEYGKDDIEMELRAANRDAALGVVRARYPNATFYRGAKSKPHK